MLKKGKGGSVKGKVATKKFVVFIVLFLTLSPFPLTLTPIYAQEGALAVAQSVVIDEGNVQNGSIISGSSSGFILSKTPYDSGIYGVVTTNPAISLTFDNTQNSYPVITTGNGYVLVSTQNGPIQKGDLITSSKLPGVGMKASQTGFVLGSAMEDYVSSDVSKIGKIAISINLRYAVSAKSGEVITKSLSNILSLSTIAALENPLEIFKYALAGFTVLISLIIAVFTFGRNGGLGIEALGRNPRASMNITLGIIINVITSVTMISAGLGAAYFIVIL